jgi:hypothetical protein
MEKSSCLDGVSLVESWREVVRPAPVVGEAGSKLLSLVLERVGVLMTSWLSSGVEVLLLESPLLVEGLLTVAESPVEVGEDLLVLPNLKMG